MANISSYPTISTVSQSDLIPVTDVSSTNKPLRNVTVSSLATALTTTPWVTVTDGINYEDGNVGIGTSSPSAKLDVTGSMEINGSSSLIGAVSISGDDVGGIPNKLTLGGAISMGGSGNLSFIDINKTNTENEVTKGLSIYISKENTSGAGFGSSVWGTQAYVLGNSTETIVDIGSLWGRAEHTGSGRVYYITGSTNRGYHNGSGQSSSIYGTFSEAKVMGTGTGTHGYVIGANQKSILDNANATVQFLQGAHCTVELGDGEVTDNAMSLLLDFDYTGTGTITGDFEYLRIQNDTLPTITGTSRAINSLSTLPSVFAGDVEVSLGKGVIISSPDGTRYRITVANGGALSAVAV